MQGCGRDGGRPGPPRQNPALISSKVAACFSREGIGMGSCAKIGALIWPRPEASSAARAVISVVEWLV